MLFHSQVRDGLVWFHPGEGTREPPPNKGGILRHRSNSLGLLVCLSYRHCWRYTEHLSNGFSCRDLQSMNHRYESTHLEVGFLLRCFQQLSAPHIATQRVPLAEELVYQWCVLPGPLVLWKAPLNALPPTPDMDRTVSRRSEPSSRTAFMGEQPNPWDVLPPQDAMSRHRGAKPSRRCELLGKISLLSLE